MIIESGVRNQEHSAPLRRNLSLQVDAHWFGWNRLLAMEAFTAPLCKRLSYVASR